MNIICVLNLSMSRYSILLFISLLNYALGTYDKITKRDYLLINNVNLVKSVHDYLMYYYYYYKKKKKNSKLIKISRYLYYHTITAVYNFQFTKDVLILFETFGAFLQKQYENAAP